MLVNSFWIEWELTNSNDGQTRSWHRSSGQRQHIETLLRCEGFVSSEPYQFKTWIRITRILGKRQKLWDVSSGLRGNSKQLIDSFVATGWFVDDSPKWITDARFAQDSSQRTKGPAILFEVFRDD